MFSSDLSCMIIWTSSRTSLTATNLQHKNLQLLQRLGCRTLLGKNENIPASQMHKIEVMSQPQVASKYHILVLKFLILERRHAEFMLFFPMPASYFDHQIQDVSSKVVLETDVHVKIIGKAWTSHQCTYNFDQYDKHAREHGRKREN